MIIIFPFMEVVGDIALYLKSIYIYTYTIFMSINLANY